MFFENNKSLYDYLKNQIKLLKSGQLRFYGNLLPDKLKEHHICKYIGICGDELIIVFENNSLVKIKNAYEIVLRESSFSVVNADEVYFEYLCEKSDIRYILYKIINNKLCKITGDIDGDCNITKKESARFGNGIAFEIL